MPGAPAARCVKHLHEVQTDVVGNEIGAAGNDTKVASIDAAAANPITVIRFITCSTSLALRTYSASAAGVECGVVWIIGTWLLTRQPVMLTCNESRWPSAALFRAR